MKISDSIWHIAIRRAPRGAILENQDIEFMVVPNPKHGWAADPFIIEKGNTLYIFAELFFFHNWKGKIGYCTYKNGGFSEWRVISHEEHHYSFPYIYKKEGIHYLMPEMSSVKELSVYQAIQFPDIWEKKEVVYAGERFVDSIYLSEDKIMSYKMGKPNQLVLLRSNNGEWTIADAKDDFSGTLRPAGSAFEYKNRIVRPVQDCHNFYGEAILFSILSFAEDYCLPEESNIIRIEPHGIKLDNHKIVPVGIHTYNGSENFEVIDVQEQRFNIHCFMKRGIMKLQGLIGR